jgi:hypothetical protein
VAEDEFQELSRQYADGQLSRRRFIGRLVAGGATMAAAVAFANSGVASAAPGRGSSGAIYGRPPVGTPPNGGMPPGRGGTPYGLSKKP